MTAVVFTTGETASAAKFNQLADAADAAQTAAAGMQASADAAALSAQHASDQAVVATNAATNTTSFATAAASNAAAAAASATAAGVSAVGATGAFNVGRNKIHNAMFNVQQRGQGPWTVAGYTADRWRAFGIHSNGSMSVTLGVLQDSQRAVIGDEEAQSSLVYVFTGGTGVGDIDGVNQFIEDVRRLAGKAVVISFWAVASSNLKLGVGISQNFGNGGSPSASVNPNATSVTLSTTWTRYTVTTAFPSIQGKTLGTNMNSSSQLTFWMSAGATWNTIAGSIGFQSGTIQLWGVQLEVGSVATALEKLDYQTELAHCQRFYQTGQMFITAYGIAGAGLGVSGNYFTSMRTIPFISLTNSFSSNVSTPVLASNIVVPSVTVTILTTGTAVLNVGYTASADL